MIIQCDQCDRKFRVDDSKIKPPGSRVRCSKCGNVFFVEKKDTTKQEDSVQQENFQGQDSASPSTDSLKVDPDSQQSAESSQIEVGIKQPPQMESPGDEQDHTPVEFKGEFKDESQGDERVWSIQDDNEPASADIEKPSIEIDLNKQPETPSQPEQQFTEQSAPGLDADSAQSHTTDQDLSPSWASLDSIDGNKPSDDDLTPPMPTETPAQNDQFAPETPEPPATEAFRSRQPD